MYLAIRALMCECNPIDVWDALIEISAESALTSAIGQNTDITFDTTDPAEFVDILSHIIPQPYNAQWVDIVDGSADANSDNSPTFTWLSSYPAPPVKSTARQNLTKYVKRWEDGPKQGDENWLLAKGKTIGGSEMAALEGSSIFKGIRDLIESKAGLTKWNGDYRTHWGNLFEPLIQYYVEWDKNVDIIGTEIWILGKSPRQSYSPDGLATMIVNYEFEIQETNANGSTIKRVCLSPQEKTVLFEFKCPFSRSPGREPPKWYIPQVKTGLDTIPIADIGLYVEAVYRRCPYMSLEEDNDEFTPTFTATTRCGGKYPLAMGFIGFYFDPINARNPMYRDVMKTLIKYFREEECIGVVDLGEAPDEIFEAALFAFIKGVLRPWYSPIVYRGCGTKSAQDAFIQDNFNKFVASCENNYRVYGILPWKMFNINYHFIEKEEGYVDQYLEKINEVMDVVDECRKNPNIADEIISSYFNKTDDHFDM